MSELARKLNEISDRAMEDTSRLVSAIESKFSTKSQLDSLSKRVDDLARKRKRKGDSDAT